MAMSSSSSSSSSTSQALVRKATDTELMPPPPPVKRIKRPPIVLDEDTYTDALSEIIARDFFPGLLEAKHQQEYLDALDSQDPEWITEASRRLATIMTPDFRDQQRRMGRRRGTGTGFTPTPNSPWMRFTPTPRFGETFGVMTPGSVRSTGTSMTAVPTLGEKVKPDTSLSLDAFQAKYTSEDNASFNDILDRQNEKRRNAYAWMWNGNKIPGNRVQMANRILNERAEKEGEAEGEKKSIGWIDDRKAAPETWKSKPRNGFMFVPEGVEDSQLALPAPSAESAKENADKKPSILPPKSISYSNTRLPPLPLTTSSKETPPSPSFSAIQDAIAGNPRESMSSVIEDGNATPRVNGYAFVDDTPTKAEMDAFKGSLGIPLPAPTATTHSPFKIAATPRREVLLNKMVDKVAKNKRASTVLGNAAKAVSGTAGTPGSSRLATPLTPAAHRLWNNVSNGGSGKMGLQAASPFDQRGSTPRVGTPAGLVGKGKLNVKMTPRATGE
ncbi:nuclear protein DGCR14 [Kalaharituber pfeilii]|nr:nuclear protein DGCR14 [Kalaharituber pfeilii]